MGVEIALGGVLAVRLMEIVDGSRPEHQCNIIGYS